MISEFSKDDRELLKQVVEDKFEGANSLDPAVLSCGGIYIPHQGNAQRIIYKILTTSDKENPVKVVTGVRPKNLLQKVLQKESMN